MPRHAASCHVMPRHVMPCIHLLIERPFFFLSISVIHSYSKVYKLDFTDEDITEALRRCSNGVQVRGKDQARMARGGYGLPKVSTGTAMPYPCTPCGRAIPETALQGERPVAVFYPFGHPTPYAYGEDTPTECR
jgi:hypothetical protein